MVSFPTSTDTGYGDGLRWKEGAEGVVQLVSGLPWETVVLLSPISRSLCFVGDEVRRQARCSAMKIAWTHNMDELSGKPYLVAQVLSQLVRIVLNPLRKD